MNLWDYNELVARAKILRAALLELEEIRKRGIKAISPSKIRAGACGDIIGQEITSYEIIKDKIELELLRVESKVNSINIAIDSLPDIDKKIIIMKYFEGKEISYIGDMIGYDRSSIYRHEKKALKKIYSILYGK